jgi:hypothetical protein
MGWRGSSETSVTIYQPAPPKVPKKGMPHLTPLRKPKISHHFKSFSFLGLEEKEQQPTGKIRGC